MYTIGLFYDPTRWPLLQRMTQRIQDILGQDAVIDVLPLASLSPQAIIRYDYLIVRSAEWHITESRQTDERLSRLAKALTPLD